MAERLNTQGMNLVTQCKLCMVGTESIEHVLFRCGTAHEAWDIAGFPPILQLANRSLVKLLTLSLSLSLSIQRMSDESLPLLQRK